ALEFGLWRVLVGLVAVSLWGYSLTGSITVALHFAHRPVFNAVATIVPYSVLPQFGQIRPARQWRRFCIKASTMQPPTRTANSTASWVHKTHSAAPIDLSHLCSG